jgi:hypothetical protein
MTPLVRAAALFCSSLQPSQNPTMSQVETAIKVTLLQNGGAQACAASMADQFGSHPDLAASRMRWVLIVLAQHPATRQRMIGIG